SPVPVIRPSRMRLIVTLPSASTRSNYRRPLNVDRPGTPDSDPSGLFYNREKELSDSMLFSPVLAFFVGGEIVDLIGQTGAVAKVVLFILIAFSVLSWGVILSKWRLISRARVQSGRFVRAFRKAQRMQDVLSVADQF